MTALAFRRRLALWICPELGQPAAPKVRLHQEEAAGPEARAILDLAAAYGAHEGLTHWRVSFLIRGNGQFLKGLKDGKTCTLKTAAKVLAWFDANWPTDLAWPAHISRPSTRRPL